MREFGSRIRCLGPRICPILYGVRVGGGYQDHGWELCILEAGATLRIGLGSRILRGIGSLATLNLSQVMNCIACLEDLGSMGNGLLIYMMAQHLVAKP